MKKPLDLSFDELAEAERFIFQTVQRFELGTSLQNVKSFACLRPFIEGASNLLQVEAQQRVYCTEVQKHMIHKSENVLLR